MDKELVKDIVGRRKWWLIAAPLIVALLVMAALLVPRDAQGVVARPVAKICPSGEWSCYTADRFSDEFKADKFDNSRGVEFTPRIKRMIRDQMRAKGIATRGDDAWWQDALSYTTCMAGPRWSGVCRRGQTWVNEVLEETMRVTVYCGGAAVIGSLAGGGGWGAGRGALACLWSRLMDLW